MQSSGVIDRGQKGCGFRRRSGVTLVEVLCVVGIIFSLAGLAFPAFSGARVAAKQTQCATNLRQVFLAAQLYSGDSDDRVPRGKDCADLSLPITWPEPARTIVRAAPLLSDSLLPYGAAREIWKCPLDTGTYTVDISPVFDFVNSPSLFGSCG